MKIIFNLIFWGFALFLGGHLMAEQFSHPWITVKGKGFQADFPHPPIEMTFDVPFQNTPRSGELKIYCVSTASGIFVLSHLTSAQIHPHWLKKEHLHQFFETTLIPYFFFNPSIFKDNQVFHYQPIQIQEKNGAAFQISYRDHDVLKRLEGQAIVKKDQLYVYFYLTSDSSFDPKILTHFLNGLQFNFDDVGKELSKEVY